MIYPQVPFEPPTPTPSRDRRLSAEMNEYERGFLPINEPCGQV